MSDSEIPNPPNPDIVSRFPPNFRDVPPDEWPPAIVNKYLIIQHMLDQHHITPSEQ